MSLARASQIVTVFPYNIQKCWMTDALDNDTKANFPPKRSWQNVISEKEGDLAPMPPRLRRRTYILVLPMLVKPLTGFK